MNFYTSYHFFLKPTALVLLCFFVFTNANSQDRKAFKFDWQDQRYFESNQGEGFTIPFVDEASIDYSTRLPQVTRKWLLPNHTQIISSEIVEVVYEDVSPDKYADLNLEHIPTSIQYQLVSNSNRETNVGYLQLLPLVKKDSSVKKIKSITLEYHTETSNTSTKNPPITSVLSEGAWYKFAVDKSGVFKIDRGFLQDLGINLNGVNPKNIQIYGNGGARLPYKIGDTRYEDLQENAIYISGEDDQEFNSGDFILFYAQGPDSWTYGNTPSSVKHIKNIYDDYGYYFIHIGNNAGKRITQAPDISATADVTYNTYDYFSVFEEEQYNLFQAGQQFLGHKFDLTTDYEYSQTIDHLDTSSPTTINIRAVAQSIRQSSMQIDVNNTTLDAMSFAMSSDVIYARYDFSINEVSLSNNTLNFNFQYDKEGNPSAKAYLDYIEIICKRGLVADDNQFIFRQLDQVNQTDVISFEIQNSANIYQIWDVSDHLNPQNITNESSSGNFSFKATGHQINTYCVLNENDFYTPIALDESAVANQNIHAITHVDYLIITHKSLLNQAEALADFHKSQHQLAVEVVPLYMIYNEFSSGAADITGIRDFVKYVYDQSQGKLAHVLMYGDASFDFKGIQLDKGLVPAFQAYDSFNMAESYVTDDFYAIVSDDSEGDLDKDDIQSQDIAISRIPVNTPLEAANVNTKIFNYYNTGSFGDWRNNMLLIADDIDKTNENVFQETQEYICNYIETDKPLFNVKKLWMDAFQQETVAGGSRYPDVYNAINKSVENGVLMVNYFGHGGEDGLSHERILETNQMRTWQNLDKLNLFTIISCEFARFDNPLRPETAGEIMIRHPHGGAVHEIATAREIYISVGKLFNIKMVKELLALDNLELSIAERLRLVKNNTTTKQRYFVFSFGDPFLTLAVPKPDIKITHMNGTPVTEELDTIQGLSLVSFKGIITDADGLQDTSFNGELTLTVFDKSMQRETLNNDGNADIMTFNTQDSKLFRGKASVTNGEFYIEFIAPKDLRIAYGEGKLSFYASDDVTEKGGYNTEIIVGGINTNAPPDNEGPMINLYMNDTTFVDGGTTDESPLFLAFIEDEHGINTSLSSVDHDITAILDEDYQNPIVLNEYFITDLDDYTSGQLDYRLRNLESGAHSITLTAYDTYNNASSATLNFVVKDNSQLEITELLNFPNPFSTSTTFAFTHNRPNQYLEVELQIFSMNGQMLKYINQNIFATTKVSKDITWDGTDDYGNRIKKGIYLYRLGLTDSITGDQAEAYNKLIILE